MGSVTVIVPSVGQRPRLLAQTIASITAQQGVGEVHIVVVDASGQNQVSKGQRLPSTVTVVASERRLNAAAARNLGATVALTEWVAYCDDDDLWAPSKLEEQLKVACRLGVGWSATGTVCFMGDSKVLWAKTLENLDDLYTRLLTDNVIPGGGSGVLVRRELVDAVGGWDDGLVEAEDWDFYIRLACVSEIGYVHAPLVGYRIHEQAKSTDLNRQADSRRALFEKHGLPVEANPPLDWVFRRELLVGNLERIHSSYKGMKPAYSSSRVLWLGVRLAPRTTTRLMRHRERRIAPEGWFATAEGWLEPLVDATP